STWTESEEDQTDPIDYWDTLTLELKMLKLEYPDELVRCTRTLPKIGIYFAHWLVIAVEESIEFHLSRYDLDEALENIVTSLKLTALWTFYWNAASERPIYKGETCTRGACLRNSSEWEAKEFDKRIWTLAREMDQKESAKWEPARRPHQCWCDTGINCFIHNPPPPEPEKPSLDERLREWRKEHRPDLLLPPSKRRALGDNSATEPSPFSYFPSLDNVDKPEPLPPMPKIKQIGALELMGPKPKTTGRYKSKKNMADMIEKGKQRKRIYYEHMENLENEADVSGGLMKDRSRRRNLEQTRTSLHLRKFLLTGPESALQDVVSPALMASVENSTTPCPCDSADDALEDMGLKAFREGQLDAVRSVVGADASATIVVLPTGHGKSLVYHVCSRMLRSLTLVVCPTISLLQDQLQKIPAPLRAARVDGTVSFAHRKYVYQALANGQVDVLLTTPEQLHRSSLSTALAAPTARPVGLTVLDEAHCVAEWGHSFRPAYLDVLRLVMDLGCRRLLCLTATASRATVTWMQDAVRGCFDMESQVIQPISQVLRPDLKYSFGYVGAKRPGTVNERHIRYEDETSDGLSSLRHLFRQWKCLKSCLVYTWTKREAEQTSLALKRQFGSDRGVCTFHSGLPDAEKTRILNGFMNDQIPIMVATMALGMGIDKQDVDGVVHANMPGSLEQLIQESGRCNRNGQTRGLYHCVVRDRDYQARFQQVAGSSPDFTATRVMLHFVMRTLGRLKDHGRDTPQGYRREREYGVKETVVWFSRPQLSHLVKSRQYEEQEVLMVHLNRIFQRDSSMQQSVRVRRFDFTSAALMPAGDIPTVSTTCTLWPLSARVLTHSAVELRFFSEPFESLAEQSSLLKFLQPYISRRKNCGTYTVDYLKLLRQYGLQVDIGRLEDALEAYCLHQGGVTCSRDTSMTSSKGSVVLFTSCYDHSYEQSTVWDDMAETTAGSVKELLERQQRVQVNRLDACCLSLLKAVEGDAEHFRTACEDYFLWDRDRESLPSAKLWSADEFRRLRSMWNRNIFHLSDDEEIRFTSTVETLIMRLKRNPMAWSIPSISKAFGPIWEGDYAAEEVVDITFERGLASSGHFITPTMLARILCGLHQLSIPREASPDYPGWAVYKSYRFDFVRDRVDDIIRAACRARLAV
ncbi:MAG: uncharacterized protein KVP18_003068, partial [Porospora cf. gigantea A]|uniref:uncharacterized protein n=2 Tax=Porospora cf. gigantea A TaxID=2853593 RepID=UPI0035593842